MAAGTATTQRAAVEYLDTAHSSKSDSARLMPNAIVIRMFVTMPYLMLHGRPIGSRALFIPAFRLDGRTTVPTPKSNSA
jgi:hypothetical protein